MERTRKSSKVQRDEPNLARGMLPQAVKDLAARSLGLIPKETAEMMYEGMTPLEQLKAAEKADLPRKRGRPPLFPALQPKAEYIDSAMNFKARLAKEWLLKGPAMFEAPKRPGN